LFGKGFGKNNDDYGQQETAKSLIKSYGEEALTPIKDLIDEESGMREFFFSNEEWQPLFRSIVSDRSAPAMSFMNGGGGNTYIPEFEFHESTRPWRRLAAIPTAESDKAVLADFLDAVQKSLIDIPVDEASKEDENDLHFIEEGRRMLVCSRFHVVQGITKGSIDSFDSLFATCWSEITELHQVNENDTGSLIVVPGFDHEDLRRFTDMNLQRPLQWLGIDRDFEVASLERGGLSVVRLIHKLSDIPSNIPDEPVE
jgi:hypothetical protein